MAYQGFLIRAGDYEIPKKFINSKTYSGYPNTLDLDSYRDGNGELQRDVLEHIPYKAEFETPPGLTASEYAEVMGNIKKQFLIPLERSVNATVFISEDNDYITQKMYVPDTKPVIDAELSDELIYEPTKIEFIGY